MKRIAAFLAFALILAGGFEPFFLEILFIDREPLRRTLQSAPDFRTPGFPRFLDQVRERTNRGDTIAIFVPMRHWDEGYAYAFYRGSYFLAGRTVIPLVDRQDRVHAERIADADFVAAWSSTPVLPRHSMIWQGEGGSLWKKQR